MKIYIDESYKCHTKNQTGKYEEVETAFFDGYCETYIEGFCFVPSGRTAVISGTGYHGECIFPWKDFAELEKAQAAWEHAQLAVVTADRDNLLSDIAALIEEVYEMDSEMMS